jgi:hypothetical protein
MNKIDNHLFHNVIANSLDILRLSSGEASKIVAKIFNLVGTIAAVLNEQSALSEVATAEIDSLIDTLTEVIREYYADIAKAVELFKVAQTVQEATANSLEVVLGARAVALPTDAYTKAVASNVMVQGAPTAAWWEAQSLDVQERFKTEVRAGVLNGETNEQIVRRVTGSDTEPGIIDVAERNARALVHTSIQTIANDARRKTYEANSDLIKGIMQVSTLDSHTTLICVAYSEAQWNLDYEPINGNELAYNGGTPRHWNCRSVEVPITKTFAELGLVGVNEPPVSTRASVDGQIKSSTTFEAFLSKKSKAFQDELLGEGRADLWRAGKITLKDLVSGQGNPLTLDELKGKVRANDIGNLFERVSKPDGGFTYSPLDSSQPEKGFAVSPYPERSFAKNLENFTGHDLLDYIETNRDMFKKKNNYIGAWNDPATGKVYLDISVVSKTEDEAKKLALKHDQIAYFDLAKGESVTVNQNATSGGVS